MPQSLSHVIIHTVFSTKNRTPYFNDVSTRTETFTFLGGLAKRLECQPLLIGGHVDHVHVLSTLNRTISQADFVKEMKRQSNIWFSEKFTLPEFAWQKGYGVFSVSESNVSKVRGYIANQDAHHEKVTFQEEFRKFLDAHSMAYDEKYVWD
jgi:REP element-mobilizing transposase RayT